MTLAVRHWAASHPGLVRTTNQDAYLCRPDIGLFVVADGVGGHGNGSLASTEVVRELDTVPAGLNPLELLAAVRSRLEAAHQKLLGEASPDPTAVNATTVVVLLLHGDHLACLWAGDSRAYLLRRGTLIQLTSDHSLVEEMLRSGDLTEAEAWNHPKGNVITRAIGVECTDALLDKAITRIERGDRFLLCSDGLIKAVQDTDLIAPLETDDPAEALIQAAIARQARDNVTALVAMT